MIDSPNKIPCGRLDTSLFNRYYPDCLNYLFIGLYLVIVFSIGYFFANDNYISVVVFLTIVVVLLLDRYYLVTNSLIFLEGNLIKVENKEKISVVDLSKIRKIEIRDKYRRYARGRFSLVFFIDDREELEIYFPSTFFKGTGRENLFKLLLYISLSSNGNIIIKNMVNI